MSCVARRVGLDEPTVLEEQLAFQARTGSPRHRSLEQLQRAADRVEHWSAVEVRDGAGALVAAGETSLASVFGPGSLQMNAVVAGHDPAVLLRIVELAGTWEPAAGATRLVGYVNDPDDAVEGMWLAAGFQLKGRRTRLRRGLTQEDGLLEVDPPPGVRIVPLRDAPELEGEADALWREAHEDVPTALAFSPDPALTIRADVGCGPQQPLPDLLLVAIDQQVGVVGVAFVDVIDPSAATGGHRMTGVGRGQRGRGIGHALKRASVRAAAAHGLTALEATNDATNPAMRRINDELGYGPVRQLAVMERAIER